MPAISHDRRHPLTASPPDRLSAWSRDRALALMHEYTAVGGAPPPHVRRGDRHARHGPPGRRGSRGMGHRRAAARLRLRTVPQRRRIRRPTSTRAKGSASSPRRGFPEPWQRAILGHAGYTGVPRDTPWRGRSSPSTNSAGSWWPAPWSAPRAAWPTSRFQRAEEAQGQGVCPRGEPGGRDPRRRGAGRAARGAHPGSC